jgi:serine/threonine protein phosphatase PrpC
METLETKPLNQMFGIFSNSVTKAGKEKCGDSFAIRELKEENLIVLAVADGVSSCPCDWRASKTACETVVSVFESASGGSLQGRMKSAAAKANSAIRTVNDACKGMLTSLSLAVWKIGTDEIHFLNVGDSRIYIGTENNLRQITVDDVAGVLMKSDGKPLIDSGVPVYKRGVTRSLGQSEPLGFEVRTHNFSSKDLLVLVSDGICKNEAFTSDFEIIFSRGDFSESLKRLVRENSQKNSDDATLIVLWRTEKSENSRAAYNECVKENADFRGQDLSGREVIEFLQADLFEKLSQNSNSEVYALLDYAARYDLRFSRPFLIDFNHRVFKQNTDRALWLRLQNLIRVS